MFEDSGVIQGGYFQEPSTGEAGIQKLYEHHFGGRNI